MEKLIRVNKKGLSILVVSTVIVGILTGLLLVFMVNKLTNIVLAGDNSLESEKIIIEQENIIEIETIVDKEPFRLVDIGEFKLTAYCPCEICCGKFAGPPLNKTGSIGVGVYEGVTVAVDPNIIPYGTKLYIEGVGVRIAADCGGAIKGNRIDVYYANHKDAWTSGLGHTPRQVYIIEEIIE